MQLKVSSLEAWNVFKAIVKVPNKVSCSVCADPETEKVYFLGAQVSYLFQTVGWFEEKIQFCLPHSAIERLAKLKKKDISSNFVFDYDPEKEQVTIKVCTALDIVEMSFFVETPNAYETWEDFYKPDFLNDLCFLTPEHIAGISNVVKSQSDLNYHLFLPEGFCAIGDYQFTIVELGLDAVDFNSTPVNLPSTLLNAVLAVDPQLAIGSNNGDYLKSESYIVTLPAPKVLPSEENLFNSEKIQFLQSMFDQEVGNIKLDDCKGIAEHLEKASTVDTTFDLCELIFTKDSNLVEVLFYKDLVVASTTSFSLLEHCTVDINICLRVKNLISALKMVKLDASLKFIDETSPICLETGGLLKTILMTSFLIKDDE